jgi:apolipoprotein N-acyltransferase
LLYALSFPKFTLFFPGFFFLIPLLYILDNLEIQQIRQKTQRSLAFLLFFGSAFLSYLLILYWIPRVMVRYGEMSKPLSIVSLIALAAFLSIFHGIAGILIKGVAPLTQTGIVLIPLIWVSKDLVIEKIFGGFPWCLAGYSQYKNLLFVQIAEIGGIHLVTFVLIYFNVLIYRFIRNREKRTAIAILISLFAVYTVGFYLYHSNRHDNWGLDIHQAGIIQPNTNNDPITRQEKNKILNRLFRESGELAKKGAEFIVWPEHSVAIYPLQNRDDYYRFESYVRTNVPLLAGFTDLKGFNEIFNSAVLFGKEKMQKYDKVHLTPFGEYVLFRDILFFVKRITDEIADFTPGGQVRNLGIHNHYISTPICYEIIFPELVREFIAKGGELIITISNDSWFGDTSAPYQHLSMAVLRGIENRRYILRSTTNGISAEIAPSGKIIYQSAYNTADAFIAQFKYIKKRTFFNCCGYLFPYFCVFLLVVYFVVRILATKRHEEARRKEEIEKKGEIDGLRC